MAASSFRVCSIYLSIYIYISIGLKSEYGRCLTVVRTGGWLRAGRVSALSSWRIRRPGRQSGPTWARRLCSRRAVASAAQTEPRTPRRHIEQTTAATQNGLDSRYHLDYSLSLGLTLLTASAAQTEPRTPRRHSARATAATR